MVDIKVENIDKSIYKDIDIAKNIKLFRLLKGYTVEELEKLSGVSHKKFNAKISSKDLKHLANTLEISVNQLTSEFPLELETLILDNQNICRNLKKLLKLKSLTYKQASSIIGLEESSIYKMVNGRHHIRISSVKLFANGFNISVEDIKLATFSE